MWKLTAGVCFTLFFTSVLGNKNLSKQYGSGSGKPKVLITSNEVSESALDLLRMNYELIFTDEKPIASKEDVIKKVKGVDAILFAVYMKLDDEILNAAGPQLKMVAALSAGYDHIDLPALKKRNISLTNTPKVLNNAVADVAVLLTLAASRRLTEGRMDMEKGLWHGFRVQYLVGPDLEKSTVGIVGLGGIGQAIAKRLKAFEVDEILYSGHKENPEGKQLGAKFVPLETLLGKSDFVIVSAPLTEETRNMFNKTTFGMMKNSSVFVNIARGQIVDQPALIEALKDGTIFAAGLDVMEPEPLPTDNELLKLPNVVLLPHIGGATINVRKDMAMLAAKNIINGLEGRPLLTPVF